MTLALTLSHATYFIHLPFLATTAALTYRLLDPEVDYYLNLRVSGLGMLLRKGT